MARAKITSYFLHEIIFLRLKSGLGMVKSMDNLLNFCHLIMMKRENPFHIDKIIRFLHHETRPRAFVRDKYRQIWIVEKNSTIFAYVIFRL